MQQAINNGKLVQDKEGVNWLSFSFKRKKPAKMDIASTYFQLLSAFNNLGLTDAEVKFLSYIAVEGGVVSGTSKIRFSDRHKTSKASIDNTIGRLKKKRMLEKKGTQVILQPRIMLSFSGNNNFIFSFKCVQDQE